jgi:hypothetical protein
MEVRKLNPPAAEIKLLQQLYLFANISENPSPEAIGYFQFLPAVAALSGYGVVNLETENVKFKIL